MDHGTIVHSGTPTPNPGELLGSVWMREAIQAAAGIFDFVVIDTLPLMPLTDPVILTPMTDGVILAVKGTKNPHEILKKAKLDALWISLNSDKRMRGLPIQANVKSLPPPQKKL